MRKLLIMFAEFILCCNLMSQNDLNHYSKTERYYLLINTDSIQQSITSYLNSDYKYIEWRYKESGTLYKTEHFYNGRENGLFLSFYKNGVTEKSSFYILGQLAGAYYEQYENGGVKCYGNYFYDINSSPTVIPGDTLSKGNSSVRVEKPEIKSIKDGEWIYYYENGSVYKKEYYIRGVNVGTWRTYDLNGKLIKKETW